MLSAFTARPIIELKARDKSKIEAILAHGDRVFVGLNSGSLRIYRLNQIGNGSAETPGSPSNGNGVTSTSPKSTPDHNIKPTELLREVDKFSSRSIDQLAIIREANTLVSLSNYHVSLHDLATYELIDTLSRTKNASCFAVTSNIVKDPTTGIPEIISRLAVAVKRRLLLWNWHDSELQDDVSEITLPESIRTITWADATRLVCGMNAGYVLVDVTTSDTREITGTGAAAAGAQGSRFGAASMGYMGLGGYIPKPLSARLAEGEMLLAKDIHSLFIDTDGKPLDKRQIPWQGAPESIGYSYPYIVALQAPAKGSLEVRNPETLSLLQAIELPGAAQLHFPPPTVSLAHAGKGFHISSDRAVWKMDATDYDTQIQELIEKGRYDEAISVLSMLEDALLKDKTGTVREVKMLKAEWLFRQKRFRDSLDTFNEDEVHAPPERVLKLYPKIIAGDLSDERPREDTPSEESQEEDSEENGEKTSKPSSVVDAASPTKAGGFAKYWLGGRKPDSDAASIISSRKAGIDNDDSVSVRAAKSKVSVEDDGPLEGKDLLNAVRELNSYLAGTRARLQRYIDPVTGKLRKTKSGTFNTNNSSITSESIDALLTDHQSESDEQLEQELRSTFMLVDTTLFRGYMFSQPTLAGSLFRIPNFCDPTVVNEKLLEHSRYNELVDFFYGKKLHREALELLQRFGEGSSKDGEKKTLMIQPGTHAEGGEGEVEMHIPEQLRGPQRTVGYLQSLPPERIDLILEFAGWVLRQDPDLGMEVFMADSENAETLPRDTVVLYLRDLDLRLEAKYLEHIINELHDGTPEFHDRLVKLLVESLSGDGKGGEKKKDDDWEARMTRLIEFLRGSRQYSLTKAFGMIPRDDPDFYEAQAVVLCNMGQHKQALEIYVFKMQDYAKAEEYCNQIHMSDPSSPEGAAYNTSNTKQSQQIQQQQQRRDSSMMKMDYDDPESVPSIYHTLLSLYLTPHHSSGSSPSSSPPNSTTKDELLPPALSLLSRHGSRLPASSTLSLIPDDLPVSDLASYFRGRVRAGGSVVNEMRVVEALRRTQLVDTQARLLGARGRKVVVPEERVCRTCHKRLGNTVLAVLPAAEYRGGTTTMDDGGVVEDVVVHYGCLGRTTTTTTTTAAATSSSSYGAGVGVGMMQGQAGRVAGSWGRHG